MSPMFEKVSLFASAIAQMEPPASPRDYWWAVPLLIVLVAVGIGARDLIRFSAVRVLAIASVCYRESIRRKVLLVIPLAIIGVLIVSRFQVPTDEQDAIRQTIKFCLFATGVLIVLTLIILACTNLPREIDNRVIYTIVTKPTTRLEIVLGKIVGFAAVSLTVLAIMGAFTFTYLHYQSWQFQRSITDKLATGDFGKAERTSLEHYQQFGLLTAKELGAAKKVSVVSSLPTQDEKYKWAPYGMLAEVLVPFEIDRSKFDPILNAPEDATDVPKLVLEVVATHRDQKGFTGPDPTSRPFIAPFVDQNADGRRSSVRVSVLSHLAEAMVDSSQIQGQGKELSEKGDTTVRIEVPRTYVSTIANEPSVYVQVTGEDVGREYGFGPQVARMYIEYPDGRRDDLKSPADRLDESRQLAIFRGRSGRGGQQISGESDSTGSIGYFQFRGVQPDAATGRVGIEVHVAIERSSWEADQDDVLTELQLMVINRSTGASSPVIVKAFPENNRTLFLSVPAEVVEGGDFDIALRSITTGHFITANSDDVLIVAGRQPFVVNLFKSLFVMWMMSVLIIIISVFTSTFLSWPIAVVLTLVLLTGRWAVVQLGDSLGSGMGNQIATNMGIGDPSVSTAVAKSVDGLTSLLKGIANFLPDISKFSAIEGIQRGLIVPDLVIMQSGIVLVLFGLPLFALSYVFLRYKEVAP